VIEDIEKYDEVMNELEEIWIQNEGLLLERGNKSRGIRSSQIAALVALLVEKGVFDKKTQMPVMFCD